MGKEVGDGEPGAGADAVGKVSTLGMISLPVKRSVPIVYLCNNWEFQENSVGQSFCLRLAFLTAEMHF